MLEDARREFYALSDVAIRAGVLTAAERDVICRRGHRKEHYWSRHLDDLRRVLARRSGRVPTGAPGVRG